MKLFPVVLSSLEGNWLKLVFSCIFDILTDALSGRPAMPDPASKEKGFPEKKTGNRKE